LARPDFRGTAARRLAEERELSPAIISLLSPDASDRPAGIRNIPLDSIRPNPEQPRMTFDEAALADLASSIREHGVLQPILVRPTGELHHFQLVAGERRWRAARTAGLKDIPALIEYFLGRLRPGERMARITDRALQGLMAYDWPGNVRELENAIEQAMVFAGGDSIDLASLPAFLREGASEAMLSLPSANMSLPEILDDLERQLVQRAYDRTGGVKTETARQLGIKTSALYYKLEKYGIGTTAGRPSGAPKS